LIFKDYIRLSQFLTEVTLSLLGRAVFRRQVLHRVIHSYAARWITPWPTAGGGNGDWRSPSSRATVPGSSTDRRDVSSSSTDAVRTVQRSPQSKELPLRVLPHPITASHSSYERTEGAKAAHV
jgi:hypothetical protein